MVSELDDIKWLRSVSMEDNSEYAHAATYEAIAKSRILLYAASPLFNGQTISTTKDEQKNW